MDLKLSQQDENFRQHVRNFLNEHLTDDIKVSRRDTHAIGHIENIVPWHKKLYEKGGKNQESQHPGMSNFC